MAPAGSGMPASLCGFHLRLSATTSSKPLTRRQASPHPWHASAYGGIPERATVTQTVVTRFAEVLRSFGIERAYGLPGEDHMPLMEALDVAGITYYTASNESSAVIMAATDALVSRVPGVAIVSMATGVSNAVNGVLHAYMEGAPVLLLSGRWTAARESIVVRQGFDPEPLVRPCTKWTATIRTANDPATILTKAIDIATSGRPGPVYIELPDEIATAECGEQNHAITNVVRTRLANYSGSEIRPTDEQFASVAKRLANAQRPVVILGGREESVTRHTLTTLASALSVPVFTSPAQKGVVNESFEWFAGSFLNGNPELDIIGKSDFILAINPEAFDYLNRGWPHADQTVAVVSNPLNEWLYAFDVRLSATPERLLKDLAASVTKGSSLWQKSDVAKYRSAVRSVLLGSPGQGMSVVEAVDAALRGAPSNVRVTADAGFSKPLVTMLSNSIDSRHFLASNALSTMGFGIPASMAASLAGSSPVLGFMGDGSLLMRATELVVARNIGQPPVFVAIMDQSLSQIEIKQERRNLIEVGIELPKMSCAKIGDAFGVLGVDVSTPSALEEAVRDAFASKRCVLIGAHVSGEDSRRLFGVLRA